MSFAHWVVYSNCRTHNSSSVSIRSMSPVSDHSSSGELLHSAGLNLELDSGESSDDDDASNDEHSRSLPSEKESFSLMSEDEMSTKSHQSGPDPAAGTMWIGLENGWYDSSFRFLLA